jgi:hypothetical protein
MDELTLPAFELDCRDWLVAEPEAVGLTEEVAGAPVLAVLSTAVIERDELYSAGAVLSLGLLDGEGLEPGATVSRLAADDIDDHLVRYLVAVPGGQLGLLAEFTVDQEASSALHARIEALMASFRWAS